MILENPAPRQGAVVGKTFLCLIGDQFARLKLGDRYFYDLGGQPGSFTPGKSSNSMNL
jgi:peroxidase